MKPTTPPAPKYWIGETIYFDRSLTDRGKFNEGRKIGTITYCELVARDVESTDKVITTAPEQWEVNYMTEHDDMIPEHTVLGLVTLGEKR